MRYASICGAVFVLGLAGCAPTITKHGHQFQENDVQKVQTGMSQQQVAGVLGSPTTTAAVSSGLNESTTLGLDRIDFDPMVGSEIDAELGCDYRSK